MALRYIWILVVKVNLKCFPRRKFWRCPRRIRKVTVVWSEWKKGGAKRSIQVSWADRRKGMKRRMTGRENEYIYRQGHSWGKSPRVIRRRLSYKIKVGNEEISSGWGKWFLETFWTECAVIIKQSERLKMLQWTWQFQPSALHLYCYYYSWLTISNVRNFNVLRYDISTFENKWFFW